MKKKTYDLYLHSGPQMKTTYVHVPQLMGCTWNAPASETAVTLAPASIRAYLGFLRRSGERVNATGFRTTVAQHDKSGGFLGSSYLPTDSEPLPAKEAEALMKRLAALHGEIRRITADLTPKKIEAEPAKGRPIRRILSHICAEGGYLRGVSGASRIQREVDQGQLDPLDALDRLHELEVERLRAMDDAERSAVIMRGQNPWSVRSAVRRMLEHGWEHYVEVAGRLGREP